MDREPRLRLLSSMDLHGVLHDPEFLEFLFQRLEDLLLGAAPRRGTLLRWPARTVWPGPGTRGLWTLRARLAHAVRAAGSRGEVRPDEFWISTEDGAMTAVVGPRVVRSWSAAVPSGLAARYLAPAAARSLGLLGTGEHARATLRVLTQALPSISVVRVCAADLEEARAFAGAAARLADVPVVLAEVTPRAVVPRSDVVAVVDDVPLDPAWLVPGSLLISHRPLPDAVVSVCRRVGVASHGSRAHGRDGHATVAGIARGEERARDGRAEVALYQFSEIDGWDTVLREAVVSWSHRRGVGRPL
ncbi:hypothetical protein AB0N07_42280 [Streptomyces sp. NPDC051172]|uniref:hypothetical protein n=1 Tax=Streptomyces sp. NPDC051172 TaxID=3155796 RepID=UPI003436DA32